MLGALALRDRVFEVSVAEIQRLADGTWSLNIETKPKIYDDESWAPRLYHQGLRLNATRAADLVGQSSSWRRSGDADYPHPELGLLYVFGHHDVYESDLRFGPIRNGRISMTWLGLCEVFYDDAFQDDVPFDCRCDLAVAHA